MSGNENRSNGRRQPPRWAAWLLATFSFTSAAFALVLSFRNLAHPQIETIDFSFVISITASVVGVLLATRRPQNSIGWLFLGIGAIGGLDGAAGQYAIWALTSSTPLPGLEWAAWLWTWPIQLVVPSGLLLVLVLTFPTGRALSPGWRRLAWVGMGLSFVQVVAGILTDEPILISPEVPRVPNPTGIAVGGEVFNLITVLALAGGGIVLVAGAVGLVVRFRRSHDVERLQLKWFVFAIAGTVAASTVMTVLFFALGTDQDSPLLSWTFNVILVGGFGVGMPVACAIAIFKHRLYDIDVVINKTVVYGALAAFITLVYVGIVVGIGTAIGQGDRPNLGLSIVATAVVAVAFQPVRERVQRFANRLVYGKRATPYEVLSHFAERMASTYAADELLPQMARILGEGTGAGAAHVWLSVGGELRREGSWPDTLNGVRSVELRGDEEPALPGSDLSVPVRDRGELLGALSIAKSRGEPVTPADRKLLSDLASQAGLVLRNVKLIEELRASRQRIVSAQDEERRRIERNIHDGAQQQLVALNVKLGLARRLATKDLEKTEDLISQLQSETLDALENLRDLARGIYPPLLRDKGLVTALEAQSRKASLPVSVHANGIPRYRQEVEAAVYFCVLEALQNVTKYAKASSVTVRLVAQNGQLTFEVEDHGEGFDPRTAKPGSGLTNMADRLEALGGEFTLTTERGRGTTVRGRVPVEVE